VVEEKNLSSRSHNTAFEGARLAGKVMRTFVAGSEVFTHPDMKGAAS
jgi:dihydroorotase